MDEVRLEPHEFIAVGESVVVPFSIVARGRATALEVRQDAVQVWELRDGRAVGVQIYADLDQAMAALGKD